MPRYTDIDGKELNDGDQVLTIQLNGKAKGGNLVKAYFKLDEKGKGMLVEDLEDDYPGWEFYKQNFGAKCYKL